MIGIFNDYDEIDSRTTLGAALWAIGYRDVKDYDKFMRDLRDDMEALRNVINWYKTSVAAYKAMIASPVPGAMRELSKVRLETLEGLGKILGVSENDLRERD